MTTLGKLRMLAERLLSAVGEVSCFFCGAPAGENRPFCPTCLAKLDKEAAVPCPACGETLSRCSCHGTSLTPLPGFLNGRTWYAHTWYTEEDSLTRQMLLSCKSRYSYPLSRYIAEEAAADLAELLPKERRKGWILTYAPRSSAGYEDHGFDQCQEIVSILGNELGIPVRQMLTRVGGEEQKSMTGAAERVQNMTDAFAAKRVPEGCRILLFDDIITTGSTIRSAGRVLAEAGAAVVFPAAYAKTVHPKWRKHKVQ